MPAAGCKPTETGEDAAGEIVPHEMDFLLGNLGGTARNERVVRLGLFLSRFLTRSEFILSLVLADCDRRTGRAINHPGNIRFRKMVKEMQEEYRGKATHQKGVFIDSLRKKRAAQGSRFLEKDRDRSRWVVAPPDKVKKACYRLFNRSIKGQSAGAVLSTTRRAGRPKVDQAEDKRIDAEELVASITDGSTDSSNSSLPMENGRKWPRRLAEASGAGSPALDGKPAAQSQSSRRTPPCEIRPAFLTIHTTAGTAVSVHMEGTATIISFSNAEERFEIEYDQAERAFKLYKPDGSARVFSKRGGRYVSEAYTGKVLVDTVARNKSR
jgi:hypothetical protein